MQQDTALASKMKALAFIDFMRSKKLISEAGTSKMREPKGVMPDEGSKPSSAAPTPEQDPNEKTFDVVSMPAFGNVRLSMEEQNEVYIQLAEFLSEKSFCMLAQKCLDYVTDKSSIRVRFANGRSLMQLQKVNEAAQHLHHLFTEVDTELTDAMILYGHCKFISNKREEALEAYYKAIRVLNLQGKQVSDPLVHQRIGAILIKQRKWQDAKVIVDMCANNYETAFSYMNLGVACLYLGDFEDAEKVLKKANILDTQNANVWGYLSLVMLRSGNRVFNAF